MTRKPRSIRRLIPVVGLALIASLALSGLAAASASASPQYWYVCKSVGSEQGNYGAGCQSKKFGGGYELSKLAEGTPLSYTSFARTPIKVRFSISGGTSTTIECPIEVGSVTVLNPIGGGAGTLTGTNKLLTLNKCKVTTPLSCFIQEEKITGYNVVGQTGEAAGQLDLTAEAGHSLLFSFVLGGACTAYSFEVGGTLDGVFNNTYSSLDFAGSGKKLKAAGASMSVEGSIQFGAARGGLQLKP